MSNLIRPSRRGIIAGLASLIAAPAIVRMASLMPIKPAPLVGWRSKGAFTGNGAFWEYRGDPFGIRDDAFLGRFYISNHFYSPPEEGDVFAKDWEGYR